MSNLSATELSRLHRQRRLELGSHRPTLLKRRVKKTTNTSPDATSVTEEGVKSPSNAEAVYSFDDELTAVESVGNASIFSAPARQTTMSPSFSSPSDAKQCIDSPQTHATTSPAAAPVVTPPPDSPTRRVAKGLRSASGSRHGGSPTTPLGPYLAKQNNRSGTPQRTNAVTRSNSSRSLPKTFVITGEPNEASDSDMPLDELMASGRGSKSSKSPLPPQLTSALEASLVPISPSPDTPTMPPSPRAIPSPQNVGSLARIVQALQERKGKPTQMNSEEQSLWSAIQSLIKTNSSTSYWEQKLEQREAEWASQQQEHDKALLAIQRVLADVTTEREKTETQLKEELERTQEQRDETILKLTQKLRDMQREMNIQKAAAAADASSGERETGQFENLKQQLEALQSKNDSLQEKLLVLAKEGEVPPADKELQKDNEEKEQRIEELEQELQSLRTQGPTETNDEATDANDNSIQEQLQEKTASLENAKMIIASLENANGSLARELRAKLKEKEEELARLTNTSTDRERTLDGLVSELRALKRQKHNPRLAKKQLANQRELCLMLEKNVSALRQAAVQHEARNDKASVDQISHIVSETFTSLKQNLESWASYLKNAETAEHADEGATTSSGEQNLERALAKKDDETKVLRKELDRVKAESKLENTKLHEEINILKERLANNMEILAKKGRELSVLRDSLPVEDNSVGYISDDGTDGYDTEGDQLPGSASSTDPSRDVPTTDASAAEIQALRNEIMKYQKDRDSKATELRAEKESLANAKMIISSLEKANKSMLEDLRSRLQDSNTAIASLLDKSMEHEKTISALRQDLKKERQEREMDERKLQTHIAKLRDENLVFSVRLAAKDRELEELQSQLGEEVPISKSRLSSVEEKKDDPASDEEN
ncbi:expressed unknown protein [Seminavis robusta]|uniref:Uncharacterized protein n=1 Tax=Seminavis robusta TaxID=568900 RepID=A0A9N8EW16_9STRA|nr:expressed unknown protein [Seminavis robusta]|eukprot:Sro1857_g302060.1 n/a (895) ;mRNA; r:13523-16207